MMNYADAVEYLYGIPKFVGKTTAENTKKILGLLGNPEEGLKIFHVAGSNGKGSVCAFIHSILTTAGFRVGLFTSPHLIKPNERICVDGVETDDGTFVKAFNTVYETVTEHKEEGVVHPSFFEFIFLMALVIFREKKITCAVIEVGLGGRLDATNAVSGQLVSVITSISLEHTEILGDTVEKIAFEKAGIIKENVPVVYDAGDIKASKVISEIAEKRNCEAIPLFEENITITKKVNKYIDFSLNTVYYDNVKFRVNFPAEYQTVNASLACMAVGAARKYYDDFKDITDEEIRRGIEGAVWAGRMEKIQISGVKGEIYLDGAHNVSGVGRFIQAVENIRTGGNMYLLFGVVAEKDYVGMIDILVKGVSWRSVFVVEPDTKRTADKAKIADIFRQRGNKNVFVCENAKDAFKTAVGLLDENDVLCVAGSLYLVGEIRRLVKNDKL